MTPVPATIDVSFNSNYAGQHRVCWRIAPAVLYNCSTLVVCPGSGGLCSITIPITVDNETCDSVTYEGYVQATCEDPSSLDGRVPFTTTFTPTPVCASYTVACIAGGVKAKPMLVEGSNYDAITPPAVAVVGGDGIGASAIAVVDSYWTILNAGDGLYTPGTYSGIPVVTLTGAGTGASAHVFIDGSGFLNSIYFTTNGIDYLPGDTITVNDPTLGPGSGIVIELPPTYGSIVDLTVVPGSGYTVTPTFSIGPKLSALGITAVPATPDLVCPAQNLGPTCDGSAIPSVEIPYGQSAVECMTSLPIINPAYTFTPDGCCYACNAVQFRNESIAIDTTLYYVSCATQEVVDVSMPAGTVLDPLCVVAGSWYWDDNAAAIVVTVGPTC